MFHSTSAGTTPMQSKSPGTVVPKAAPVERESPIQCARNLNLRRIVPTAAIVVLLIGIAVWGHATDWTSDTPDGVLEPGMVLCVESYIGRLGGHEGVKIEEQILITETGNEQLSTYPLDARLLG